MIAESIIVALVVGGTGLLGQVFITKNSNEVQEAVINEKMKQQTKAIEKLENKVMKHNSFMERLALSEQCVLQLTKSLEKMEKTQNDCLEKLRYQEKG